MKMPGNVFINIAKQFYIKRLVPAFCPTISLSEGIARTVSAYRANHFQDGVDWTYDAKCDEIINKWSRLNGQGEELRFVNYLQDSRLESYAKYLNALSKQDFGFRLFRKGINVAARLTRTRK